MSSKGVYQVELESLWLQKVLAGYPYCPVRDMGLKPVEQGSITGDARWCTQVAEGEPLLRTASALSCE